MLTRCPVRTQYPMLARHSVRTWHSVLRGDRRHVLAAWILADTEALAHPDSAGTKHAPQFAGARQVDAITRAQREVLVIAGKVADRLAAAASVPAGRCRIRFRAGVQAGRIAATWCREPVIWIRPYGHLLGVLPRRADALGELRQLVPASLADSREGYRVPGQIQRDLIWLPGSVTAAHCLDRQHRTINATQRPHNGTLTSRCPNATPPAPEAQHQALSGPPRHVLPRYGRQQVRPGANTLRYGCGITGPIAPVVQHP
jgi:hypothetical protein